MIKDNTQEELLKPFQLFFEKIGRFVKTNEITKENSFPFSARSYSRHFGTLTKIAELCDQIPNKKYWDRESILEAYIPLSIKLNRCPKQYEVDELSKKEKKYCSRSTILRVFGSWECFSNILGFLPNNTNSKLWDKESIIEIYKPIAIKLGRCPTKKEVDKYSKESKDHCCSYTVIKYFDSWKYFSENLGFYANYRIWKREDILQSILIESNNNEMLISREITQLSTKNKNFPSLTTILNNFGSLENVAELLNLTYVGHRIVRSKGEIDLCDYIKSIYKNKIITSDRTIIDNGYQKNKEIDILLPSLKIGIEYNGDYWHSFNNKLAPKDENYHIDKTNKAKEKGYDLIHIYEHEWLNNKKEIENYLNKIINTKELKKNGEVGSIFKIDNMKPIRYINTELISKTSPELKNIGEFKSWNCGYSLYKIIEV